MQDHQAVAKVQSFLDFVKNYFGALVSVSGIPILAAFWGLEAPSTDGTNHIPKLITSLTALACSLVLFLLFSNRYATAQWRLFKTAVISGFLFISGSILLLVYYDKVPLTNTLPEKYQFPANVALYSFGLISICAGSIVVFLHGFVRGEERLAQIIPGLDHREFEELMTLAKAVRGEVVFEEAKHDEPVRKAYKEISGEVVKDAVRRINRISEGILEIFGPDVNHAYERFASLVRKQLRAVSKDELDYWANDKKCQIYLDLNSRLIQRGCRVERTFLITREPLERKHCEALERQMKLGIGIRVAYLDMIEDAGANQSRLDFGLLDEFAVSFWDFDGTDRFFSVHILGQQYGEYDRQYDRIKRICVNVPGKQRGDDKLFESVTEFDAWKRSVIPLRPTA
jgi:hypothetical protein